MTVEVIDLEDAMPYVEERTREQTVRDIVEEFKEIYSDQAQYHRRRKDFNSAATDQYLTNEFRRIAANPDPEGSMQDCIRHAAYILTELKDAQEILRQETEK
jgi:uncharacterized protein YllA (UPF0747 family)